MQHGRERVFWSAPVGMETEGLCMGGVFNTLNSRPNSLAVCVHTISSKMSLYTASRVAGPEVLVSKARAGMKDAPPIGSSASLGDQQSDDETVDHHSSQMPSASCHLHHQVYWLLRAHGRSTRTSSRSAIHRLGKQLDGPVQLAR